jgi:hypothetical protein
LYPAFKNCIDITIPKPGTKSLPLGTSTPFTASFLSFEPVLELVELVDVFVEVVVDPVDVDDVFAVSEVAVVVVVVGARSCTVTDSVTVVCAFMDLLITEFGFVGLTGLIGLVGLFRFVAVIVQVSNVVDHEVQVGEEYGSEHIEERICVISPA